MTWPLGSGRRQVVDEVFHEDHLGGDINSFPPGKRFAHVVLEIGDDLPAVQNGAGHGQSMPGIPVCAIWRYSFLLPFSNLSSTGYLAPR